ncbi:protein lethal(2)essential for life-like [Cylas formicarius]|uniref:protein lethal(2)essential for life-like n=1 Tax=Cylas formicarius TaxID=197179 RepID=UPI0029583241|nr:protein lethal(2)essential for life-like [Cylas formicarius]
MDLSLLPLMIDSGPLSPASRWAASPLITPEEFAWPTRRLLSQISQFDNSNLVVVDKDKFQVHVDVQQFKPNEISVKLNDDNTVTVEGKHEERQDEHGYVARSFVRRYQLPDDVDVEKLASKLSSDGVLTISAPKKARGKTEEYREIPITRVGPVKSPETKTAEESKQ